MSALKMLSRIERAVVEKLSAQGGNDPEILAANFLRVRALHAIDRMPSAVKSASKGASLNHRHPVGIPSHFAAGTVGVESDPDGAYSAHLGAKGEPEDDATIVPVDVAKKRLDRIAKRLAKTGAAKKAKKKAAKAWADSRAKVKGRTKNLVDNDSRAVDSDSGGKALPADSGDSDSGDSGDSGDSDSNDSDSYVGDGDDVAEDLHQNAFAVGFNEGIALARRARKSR